jgi:hypothetical protein
VHDPSQAKHLLPAQQLPLWHIVNPLRRHAIGAAQIATIRHRET